MVMNRIYPLNDNWRLLDGNKENQNYHIQLLQDSAVPVQLPCFTMMYLEDHVGISWFEKQFELADNVPYAAQMLTNLIDFGIKKKDETEDYYETDDLRN